MANIIVSNPGLVLQESLFEPYVPPPKPARSDNTQGSKAEEEAAIEAAEEQ